MTFGQMQALFWQRIDQAGSPDFTPQETDRLLNWGYDIWYIINRKKFDTDQANSVNMTHLIRPFSFIGKSEITVVGVGADIPDFRDLATMRATFPKMDCNGTLIPKQNTISSVTPIPLSVLDVNQLHDPFNKPTDEWPMYVQSNNGTFRTIELKAETLPPDSIDGNYFKKLQNIDAQNTPNVEFEAQDYVARQVIDIAKILAKGDLDDYPAVKNAVQETAMVLV